MIIRNIRGQGAHLKYHFVGYYLGNDMNVKDQKEGAFIKNEHSFFIT